MLQDFGDIDVKVIPYIRYQWALEEMVGYGVRSTSAAVWACRDCSGRKCLSWVYEVKGSKEAMYGGGGGGFPYIFYEL